MLMLQMLSNIINWILALFKKKPTPAPTVTSTGAPTVAFINATTVLSDAQISPVVQALQVAISRDFAPIWGKPATLVQVAKGKTPPAGSWWMVLMDTSDVAGALGYHDITTQDLPLGKIFVKTTMDDGAAWSVCAAHELEEALVDPFINGAEQNADGIFYAREVNDAVEDDSLAYEINGVKISDFVTPKWFDPSALPGEQMDFCRHLSKPFELAPGGYIGVLDPNNPTGGWGIITADKSSKTLLSSRAPVGSRRDKRRTPRSQWVRSTVKF